MIHLLLPLFFAQTSTNNADALNSIAQNIDGDMYSNAQQLYVNTLMPLCVAVAQAVLPTVLTVEMTFCGFRIIEGKPIVAQAARFLLVGVICYAVIFDQLPQRALIAASTGLRDSGQVLGAQIINQQLSQLGLAAGGSDVTPVQAWALWTGQPSQESAGSYKYGYSFIRQRIMKSPWDTQQGVTSEIQKIDSGQASASSLVQNAITNNQAIDATALERIEQQLQSFFISMLVISTPLEALAMALPIATNIMAGTMAPALVTGSILAASYFAFYIALALGTTIVPFTFFSSFEKGWQEFLRFAVGLSLIPLFFYLFAAIGFLFSTELFELMFPKSGTGMGDIVGGVLNGAIVTALSALGPLTGLSSGGSGGSGVGGYAAAAVGYILPVFLILGRQIGGCVVVTGFILAGAGFPLASARIALAWQRGFADDAIFNGIVQGFQQIQGAVGSGIGIGYQTGMQIAGGAASSLISGFGRGFGGK